MKERKMKDLPRPVLVQAKLCGFSQPIFFAHVYIQIHLEAAGCRPPWLQTVGLKYHKSTTELLRKEHACFLIPTVLSCWQGGHKLMPFRCPWKFTALLCFSSGILHHLPELNDESHTKVVISQRLKSGANWPKLNSRHNRKADDTLWGACILLSTGRWCHWQEEHKLTSFCCPWKFTAL